MGNENPFLGTFRGHSKRPTSIHFVYFKNILRYHFGQRKSTGAWLLCISVAQTATVDQWMIPAIDEI